MTIVFVGLVSARFEDIVRTLALCVEIFSHIRDPHGDYVSFTFAHCPFLTSFNC